MNLLKCLVSYHTSLFFLFKLETIFLEEAIIHDTQQTEKAIADLSPSIIVDSTSNIIRRANRVLLVTQQEIENSEDKSFTQRLKKAADVLKQSKLS